MNPSLTRLTELLPPPEVAAPKDWAAVEEQLGTELPRDYKELVDTYGGGLFDANIWLLEPGCQRPRYDLIAMDARCRESLKLLWDRGELRPAELDQEEARLIPWAYEDEGGEVLYFLSTPGQKPENWPILINEGRGPGWERHDGPCTSFLLRLMTGEIESEYFPDMPLDEHVFETNEELFTNG
ncbi:SMI1/KNR4 family protein [Streptomyces sp. SID161]|uniref:SMI1/KNR4 family protein n=1 Tax=Streptomyces sp. SID161 TaxID=2690251 RepID=UPI001369E2A2|nr:SMI1/KNR4 family protein [Streptomyces sp. SID161]MYW46111.1 SMI1/KNR4 family protein [Streptomyces sp. SID161]